MFESDPIRGYLAKDRLRCLLEQMRINDPAVHEFLWRQYDTDYNGKIDFQEFWYPSAPSLFHFSLFSSPSPASLIISLLPPLPPFFLLYPLLW